MQRSPYLPALIVAVGMIVICRLRDRVFPGTEGTGIPQAIAALEMGERRERAPPAVAAHRARQARCS